MDILSTENLDKLLVVNPRHLCYKVLLTALVVVLLGDILNSLIAILKRESARVAAVDPSHVVSSLTTFCCSLVNTLENKIN